MRSPVSFQSRTKFAVAAGLLSAALLAFVGNASAEPKEKVTLEIGEICVCQEGCKRVKWCLLQYCYFETVCGDCINNCTSAERTGGLLGLGARARWTSDGKLRLTARVRQGAKICLYFKGNDCVTHVRTVRRR